MALTPNSIGEEGVSVGHYSSSGSNYNGGGDIGNGNGNGSGVKGGGVLKHNPGTNVHWTPSEQDQLEELLQRFASVTPPLLRYAKIGLFLKDKTVRDVALRIRWTLRQRENGNGRCGYPSSKRKIRDKKEKGGNSSHHLEMGSNGPQHSPLLPFLDVDGQPTCQAIGGDTGWLLGQNDLALEQVSENLDTSKIDDNIILLIQTRDNFISILNSLSNEPIGIGHLPAVALKLNEKLLESIIDMRVNGNLPGPSAPP